MKLKIFTDGGSRGNPGEAAIGIVIYDKENGKRIAEISKCIGIATNNIAEYKAILHALEYIGDKYPVTEIEFFLDSQLIARQLSGEYRVKDAKLRPLFEKIKKILDELSLISKFTHVRREKNHEADALVNKALDEKCTAKD